MKDPNAVYFWSKGPEEFRFLSNFYPARIVEDFYFEQEEFSSAEHYFQAYKFKGHPDFYRVVACKSAWEAKKLADSLTPNVPDWGKKRVEVMHTAISLKFQQNEDLKQMLLATDGFELVHFAPWGDKFWGVGKDYEGENMQGKVTMQVRDELRKL